MLGGGLRAGSRGLDLVSSGTGRSDRTVALILLEDPVCNWRRFRLGEVVGVVPECHGVQIHQGGFSRWQAPVIGAVVAIYTRVSHEDAEQPSSTRRQESACREFAQTRGWDIVESTRTSTSLLTIAVYVGRHSTGLCVLSPGVK